uniref:Uncharacterized protein n=1 Tax=viral metagenome TaxID=1070528 RepID=A0A6M3JC67_9ZZZZ
MHETRNERIASLEAKLSRLTALINDDVRAEKVVIKYDDYHDHWKRRKAIDDYRADLLKEVEG